MDAAKRKLADEKAAWIEAHVSYQGDGCLIWPFRRHPNGRAMVGYKSGQYWVHRLICALAHGEPPPGKPQAMHTCGKGHYGCVNPRHLRWGDNSENQIDRYRHGNRLANRRGGRRTITDEQLETLFRLRRQGMGQVEIGRRLGFSLGTVQYWLKYRAARGIKRLAPVAGQPSAQ
jgi:hypothetical protein